MLTESERDLLDSAAKNAGVINRHGEPITSAWARDLLLTTAKSATVEQLPTEKPAKKPRKAT
jgi:hypothetical protein